MSAATHARRRVGGARASRGFTFIELLMALLVIVTLTAGVLRCVAYSSESVARTPVRATAVNAVAELAERIAATPIDSVYATWGPGGTEGPTFTVAALAGVKHSGKVVVVIDETKTDAALGYSLGMPRDLDGDGVATNTNVSTTARVLLVMLDLSWDHAGSKNNHVRLPVTVMRAPKPAGASS